MHSQKTIIFRPLRRIKKTGKITVASYMQWRKVKTADYSDFKLVVDDEYKGLPENEFVYRHDGKQLFFFNYWPDDINIYRSTGIRDMDKTADQFIRPWGACHVCGGIMYSADGLDCDGVPAFAHYTANYAASYDNINQFEPLTVGIVVKWFGWFLYQLENTKLQIGK